MFKNRIRTAAIAGIAALATGLTGTVVAAPAFAQDTVQAPNAPAGEYWDSQDASAAFDAQPVNHSESDLKAASDLTQKAIVEDLPNRWTSLQSNLNWDPSEEARAGDIRNMHEAVIEEQQRNSETIRLIQESIAYAFQQDQEAAAAWQALVERAHEISNELYTRDQAPRANSQIQLNGDTYGPELFIPRGGDELTRKPLAEFAPSEYYTIAELLEFYIVRDGSPDVPALPAALSATPTDAEVREFYEGLLAFIEDDGVESAYNLAGEFLYDQDPELRISRGYATAIIELYEETEGYLGELEELREASRDASREAQQSDVLVRQGFLARAVAQRDLLRNWEGYLLAWARYIELYNDPTLTSDQTLLSTEYRLVLDDLEAGLERNTPILVEIDELVTSATDVYFRDLQTNADVTDVRDDIYEDWDFALVEERLAGAFRLLGDIRENGAIWREALNRVQALEIRLGQPSDTDRLIDAIENILEGRDNDDLPPADNNQSAGLSSVDADLSSGENAGVFGIVAVIAAILAAIGLAIPALGITLPF